MHAWAYPIQKPQVTVKTMFGKALRYFDEHKSLCWEATYSVKLLIS